MSIIQSFFMGSSSSPLSVEVLMMGGGGGASSLLAINPIARDEVVDMEQQVILV